jgi:hypothetical protein
MERDMPILISVIPELSFFPSTHFPEKGSLVKLPVSVSVLENCTEIPGLLIVSFDLSLSKVFEPTHRQTNNN